MALGPQGPGSLDAPVGYAGTVLSEDAGTVLVDVPAFDLNRRVGPCAYVAPAGTPVAGDACTVVFTDGQPLAVLPGVPTPAAVPAATTSSLGTAKLSHASSTPAAPVVVEDADPRNSDARAPTDDSVTPTKLKGSPAVTSGHGVVWNGSAWVDANLVSDSDSRLTDTRTPTDGSVTNAKVNAAAAIAESKLNLASDAAAATASRRTVGKSALQAADGADTEYAFSSYIPVTDWRIGSAIAGGTAASTLLIAYTNSLAVAAASSAFPSLYLDPAAFPGGATRTLKLRLQAAVITNAVAPAVTFTFHLYAIATWGGASGANPTVASLGASQGNVAIATPAAGGPSAVSASADFTFPSAGWYVLAVVTSGTTAANSASYPAVRLQRRNV